MSDQTLVWIDLETTGLEPRVNDVLEVAVVVTEGEGLQIVEQFHSHLAPKMFAREELDEFITNMHGPSGLLDLCYGVRNPIDHNAGVWRRVHEVITRNVEPKSTPLCGSTVGFDRAFLKEHAPSVEVLFHYRNIDVSSIKETVRRFRPELALPPTPEEQKAHRALPDVLESIKEFGYYLTDLLIPF